MPFPLDFATFLFFILFSIIFFLFTIRERRKPLKKAVYEFGVEKLSLKYDLYRKLSHFIVTGIFLIYFYIGRWVIEEFNSVLALTPAFWNVPRLLSPTSTYGQYMTMFLVSIAFIGLNITDFFRILRPEDYPLKAVNKILREREKSTMMGPHVAFSIGCLSVIMIIGPYFPRIACAAISISSFGDATANIIGRKFGKHQLRVLKTWEGLLGGAVVSYIVSFLFLMYEEPLVAASMAVPAIVALAGTITFCFVDYFTPVISDNLLNAFLSGSIMVITAFVLVLF